MPHQSPEEIEAQWQTEFPGTTYTIKTLRHGLIQAHLHLNHSEFELNQLHLELNATGLPCRHWNARTHRQIKFHHHLKSQADRDFHRALKALQSTHKQTKSPVPAKPEAPSPEKGRMTLHQTPQISIVDGKTVTRIVHEEDAAYWLRRPQLEDVGFFARQFCFEDLDFIVPPEYQYVLTHEGRARQVCRCITIQYTKEEFLRLCRLEVEAGTGHLLDGDRADYWHLI